MTGVPALAARFAFLPMCHLPSAAEPTHTVSPGIRGIRFASPRFRPRLRAIPRIATKTGKCCIYAYTVINGSLLVRDARQRAGLSVRSLASAAGVSPSTVSRIESAHMDPTVGMLTRLLAAAGHDLELSATKKPVPSIASLASAWHASARGDIIDWTRLRAFLDYLQLHPESTTTALRNKPAASGSALLDNILAGIAETESKERKFPAPAWTKSVPKLQEPWASPGTPRQQARAHDETPPALAVRGITLARSSLWRESADA